MIHHFYMRQVDKFGRPAGDMGVKDLEVDFQGLKYVSCKGLANIGEPKNIYTEDYAEADGLRVYHPGDVAALVRHKETAIELELVFLGEDRRAVYEEFRAFLEAGRVHFWDTARLLKAELVLTSAVEPVDDTVKGVKYIRAAFKFKNLYGRGIPCDVNGVPND